MNNLEIIRASEIERIWNCPASWRATRDMAEEVSEDSARGTRLHKAMETFDCAGMSAEDKKACGFCREKLNEIREAQDNIETLKEVEELRLYYNNIFTGQIDRLIFFADNSADVIDYKFGRQPVQMAAYNKQMAAYAVLVRKNYPTITRVRVHIIQPDANNAVYYSSSEYTDRDLSVSEKAIVKCCQDALSESAKFAENVGDFCQYCKFKGKCLTQKKNLEKVANVGLLIEQTRDLKTATEPTKSETNPTEKSAGFEITENNALEVMRSIKKYKQARAQADKLAEAWEREVMNLYSKSISGIDGLILKRGRITERFDALKTFEAMSNLGLRSDRFLSAVKPIKTALIAEIVETLGVDKQTASKAFYDACESAGAIERGYAEPTIALK